MSFPLTPDFTTVTSVTSADGSGTTCHFRGVTMGPLCDTSKSAGKPHGSRDCDTCDASKGPRGRGEGK
jgi:hypothetical protein